jgi:hypothetical protein
MFDMILVIIFISKPVINIIIAIFIITLTNSVIAICDQILSYFECDFCQDRLFTCNIIQQLRVSNNLNANKCEVYKDFAQRTTHSFIL